MNIITGAIVLIALVSLPVLTEPTSMYLVGEIGKNKIQMQINVCQGDSISGMYFYNHYMKDIRISGQFSKRTNSLTIKEDISDGVMQLAFSNDSGICKGTWKGKSKDYKVNLRIVARYHEFGRYNKEEETDASGSFPILESFISKSDTINRLMGFDIPPKLDSVEPADSNFKEVLIATGNPIDDDETPRTSSSVHKRVRYLDNDLLIIETDWDEYVEGAAHPTNGNETTIFRINDKNLIILTMADLVKNDSCLDSIIEMLNVAMDSDDSYFERELRHQSLNNFMPNPEGLTFHFNAYDNRPYVCGGSDILLLWSSISRFLKEDNPLKCFSTLHKNGRTKDVKAKFSDVKLVQEMIALEKRILLNLDSTHNTGTGFDYWPDGGIRIAYYHLASFASYATISALSPFPVFTSGPHQSPQLNIGSRFSFGHFNPAFIHWLRAHVEEIISDREFTKTTRKLFITYLGETAKIYRISYITLNQHPSELAELLLDYQTKIDNCTLPERYYQKLADQNNRYNAYAAVKRLDKFCDSNLYAPAVYFWLRRILDGTHQEIFATLESLLDAYGI